jgi:putative acetyltransferase
MDLLADERLDTISGRRFTPEQEREFLQKAAAQERAVILLALDGPAVVGVLDLWAGSNPFDRHTGRLGMSVLKGYRRTGIGRKLLNALIMETKVQPDFCRIELEVVSWNIPAIRLYESSGFKTEGTKRKAVDLRGKPEDTIIMALVW